MWCIFGAYFPNARRSETRRDGTTVVIGAPTAGGARRCAGRPRRDALAARTLQPALRRGPAPDLAPDVTSGSPPLDVCFIHTLPGQHLRGPGPLLQERCARGLPGGVGQARETPLTGTGLTKWTSRHFIFPWRKDTYDLCQYRCALPTRDEMRTPL